MVIVLWIFAIVACCALCVWGIATAVRRSNERRARSGALGEIRLPGAAIEGAVMFKFKLAAIGLFLIVATFMWLPPAFHAGVTAAILLLVLLVPVVRSWFTHHVN